jgi:hypothetical protein
MKLHLSHYKDGVIVEDRGESSGHADSNRNRNVRLTILCTVHSTLVPTFSLSTIERTVCLLFLEGLVNHMLSRFNKSKSPSL